DWLWQQRWLAATATRPSRPGTLEMDSPSNATAADSVSAGHQTSLEQMCRLFEQLDAEALQQALSHDPGKFPRLMNLMAKLVGAELDLSPLRPRQPSAPACPEPASAPTETTQAGSRWLEAVGTDSNRFADKAVWGRQ